MPTEAVETIERVLYAGVIGWREACVIGGLLALLTAILLWRERRVTGSAIAALFWVLRVSAIALVLWMLLQPTRQSIERVAVPKTIAVAVDASRSMQTAEPLSAADEARWGLAGRDGDNEPPLADADAALVALRHAGGKLRRAADQAEGFAAPEDVRASLENAVDSATSASEHLRRLADTLADDDTESADLADGTADDLIRDVAEPLEAIADEWESGAPEDIDLTVERVVDLRDQLATLERRFEAVIAGVTQGLTGPPADAAKTRAKHCLEALDRLESVVIGELSESVRVKRVVFDQHASPLSDQGWSEAFEKSWLAPAEDTLLDDAPRTSTDLAAPLAWLGQDAVSESLVAVLLISDGGHNTPESDDPTTIAAGLPDVPIYAAPIGSQEPVRDLELSRIEAPAAVAVKDRFTIEALLTGRNLEGERAEVELRRDGVMIERRTVEFVAAREDHRLRFELPAEELGRHEYDLLAEPLEDEVSEANNTGVAIVRVVRDALRVLLADRISRYEYRYLDQLFRRDKRVEFDKVLFLPELVATGAREASKRLPSDVESWADYDVAILGDLGPEHLGVEQQASLEEWIRERGGRAVVIAGEEHMPGSFEAGPLLTMLPVQPGGAAAPAKAGYVPSLTPAGLRSEALLLNERVGVSARLWGEQFGHVPIYYVSPFRRAKPAARVWLEAARADARAAFFPDDRAGRSENALLAWQEVGAGRVVFIASPATWHLRFRRGDELHHRFWGQLLRWLTAPDRGRNASRLFVQTDDAAYDFGDAVEVTVSLTDRLGAPLRGARLEAVAESLTSDAIATPLEEDPRVPGRYFGRFERLDAGAYRVVARGPAIDDLDDEDRAAETAAALIDIVSPDDIEMADTRGNLALMRAVAEASGGQLIPPTAMGEILRLSASEPRVIETETRTPLWNRWSYLGIVLGCLGTEWIVRRQIGLV